MSAEELFTTRVVDGVAVLSLGHVSIREERRVLRTLESLRQHLARKKDFRLLLDMAKVEYLSSASLGVLIGLLKNAKNNDGTLKLCCLGETIQELFRMMQLDKIFEVHRTFDEAMASFETQKVTG